MSEHSLSSTAADAEVAFRQIVSAILQVPAEVATAKDRDDALHESLSQLQQDRRLWERHLSEIQGLRSSRAWRVVHALRRLRRFAVPPGSLRARVARKVWRTLRAASSPSGASQAHRRLGITNREHDAAFNDLLARRQPGQRLFIFLPSIPWTCDLFQRPQHLARNLAQAGHLVIYDCSGTSENLYGLEETEPNLYRFKGDANDLTELPDVTLWSFTYNYSLRDQYPLGTSVVYDWIDDLTVFPYDQRKLRREHERALREADVVVSVAKKLHAEALKVRPDAIYLPNAVEYDRFANPTAEVSDPVLSKLIASGKPIAGYYGAMASWFDLELLDRAAGLRPNWNFLLIGPDYDGSLPGHAVLKRDNVHWVGPKPYSLLPAYLQAMTCATIPFKINEITLATSPLKLYEYLAGGKPVITTPMPECMAYPEVRIVRTAMDFVKAMEESIGDSKDEDACAQRRAVAKANSWSVRSEIVLRRLRGLDQVRQLRTPHNDRFFQTLVDYFEPSIENPCYRLWFEYALTTNTRGLHTAQILSEHTSLQGQDYLDVGCAYGGFVAAFAQHGANVQGCDLDPTLLRLARTNLREQSIHGPLHQIDATSDLMANRFENSQDVITCNDVIEHVNDPGLLVKNLSKALRPGGYLYLEIPNKDYLPYIVEDGHFKLFGITLLEHAEAKAYYQAAFPGAAYTVGHYLTLPEYEMLLKGVGLEMTLLEGCVKCVEEAPVLRSAKTLAAVAEERLATVPEIARERVREELRTFLDRFHSAPRASSQESREFLIRYGVSFWQILAHKPSTAESTPALKRAAA